MGMKTYVVRRLALAVVTIFFVATLMFVLFRMMPGDPTATVLSPALSEAVQEQMARQYGLNEPLHIQYIKYLGNVITFSFGYSFFINQPVREIIARRVVNTLVLMGTGLLLAYVIGTTMGAVVAWKQGTTFETSALVTTILCRSAPIFFVALILLYVFAFKLQWLPIGHMIDPTKQFSGPIDLYFSWTFFRHLILPVLATIPFYMAYPLLLMRTTMLQVKGEDYVKMSRAKGVRERNVFFKHAVRNSLLPIVTTIPIVIGIAVAGNVLVETIFSWPGIGRTLVQAVVKSDYPLAQAAFLLISLIVIFGNFLADIAYSALDPRITYD